MTPIRGGCGGGREEKNGTLIRHINQLDVKYRIWKIEELDPYFLEFLANLK